MQAKKVEVINPYNNKQVEQMNDFCLHQGIDNAAGELLAIQKRQREEDYQKNSLVSPVLCQYLAFFEDDKIQDYCKVQMEKDMKRCFLSFPDLIKEQEKREIVPFALSYVLADLKVEEVFVKMKQCNRKTSHILEKYGFESLGVEEQENVYMLACGEDKKKERNRSYS